MHRIGAVCPANQQQHVDAVLAIMWAEAQAAGSAMHATICQLLIEHHNTSRFRLSAAIRASLSLFDCFAIIAPGDAQRIVLFCVRF
jgi:hypothetical protein